MQLHLALLATALLAKPLLAYDPDWSAAGLSPNSTSLMFCVNDTQAMYIVNQYISLLEQPTGPDFNATAEALLAETFVVYSDSINLLSNETLGDAAYQSKSAFIAGQAQTPAIPNITTQDVFHDCEKIAWRWVGSGIASNQDRVSGIITMNIENGQIAAVFSEFNSGAWLVDIGKI